MAQVHFWDILTFYLIAYWYSFLYSYHLFGAFWYSFFTLMHFGINSLTLVHVVFLSFVLVFFGNHSFI